MWGRSVIKSLKEHIHVQIHILIIIVKTHKLNALFSWRMHTHTQSIIYDLTAMIIITALL